ncbi:MAG: hypothetical protein H7Y07_12650 [Pyrinomonadaceae bacterium]|nr:hypothetical protein [Sphingobacteriaceae bacterium]
METDKAKWIDKVMDSGSGIHQLRAPDHLYGKIMDALEHPDNKSGSLSFIQFRQLIVAASVLVVVNIGVLFYTTAISEKPAHSAYAVDSYNLSFY